MLGLPRAPSPQELAQAPVLGGLDFLVRWRCERSAGPPSTAVPAGLSLLLPHHHALWIVRQLGKEKSQIFRGHFSIFSPTSEDL